MTKLTPPNTNCSEGKTVPERASAHEGNIELITVSTAAGCTTVRSPWLPSLSVGSSCMFPLLPPTSSCYPDQHTMAEASTGEVASRCTYSTSICSATLVPAPDSRHTYERIGGKGPAGTGLAHSVCWSFQAAFNVWRKLLFRAWRTACRS